MTGRTEAIQARWRAATWGLWSAAKGALRMAVKKGLRTATQTRRTAAMEELQTATHALRTVDGGQGMAWLQGWVTAPLQGKRLQRFALLMHVVAIGRSVSNDLLS